MNKDAVKIILCDDDEDDRDFFTVVASQWSPGASVKTVVSAHDLLGELNVSCDVDLVFLDLNMPVISGQECLKMIRSDAALDSVPVIIYSTSDNDVDVEAAFRAGANLYVQKPSSVAALKEILESIAAMGIAGLMDHQKRKFLLVL
jgi:CheY-like chemotaxis protein